MMMTAVETWTEGPSQQPTLTEHITLVSLSPPVSIAETDICMYIYIYIAVCVCAPNNPAVAMSLYV